MLSRFLSDSGSAVSDFVLILIPASSLAIPLLSLISLMHSSIVTQQVAYDVARYSALADTSSAMNLKYLNSRDSSMKVTVTRDKTSCLTEVSVSRNYPVGLMDFSVGLASRASVQCEDF